MRSGRARLEIAVHLEKIVRVLATFVFVTRFNCIHCMISPDLPVSVFGTEVFSSDLRSIDILVTLQLRGLSQKVVDFCYNTRLCDRNSMKSV